MFFTGVFPKRLKFAEVKHTFKKGDKIVKLTINLFLYLHHFQRYFKKLFIIEFIIILIIITSLQMKNLVSGMHHQQILRLII